MALRDLIFQPGESATVTVATPATLKNEGGHCATATPATIATLESEIGRTVAKVATVAVAMSRESKNRETFVDPVGACPTCGNGQYWQLPGESWHCRRCEPMSEAGNLRATTLTL